MPTTAELFSDVASNPAQLALRTDEYVASITKANETADRGEDTVAIVDGKKLLVKGGGRSAPQSMLESILTNQDITKNLTPESLASVQNSISAALADLQKSEITTSSPLSSGFVPYDLEAPAKLLFPRPTPLRNRTPRVKGQGLFRRYKRITGVTGSGTGGVASASPFFAENSTMTVGSLTLRRPPNIAYAADEFAIPDKEYGFSTDVTWAAQYSGLGFQDNRGISETALLYSTMLGEERAMLGARGTDSGLVGVITHPGTPSVSYRAAAAGETGNSATIADLYFRVTAISMFGETNAPDANELHSTGLAATTGDVAVLTWTDVTGAVGYNAWAGTVSGAGTVWYAGTTGDHSIVVNFTGGGTGGTPNSGTDQFGNAHPDITANTSASAAAWDGLLGVLLDPTQSGYIKRLNTTFSTTNPGGEYQTAFASLYNSVKADPDRILFNGFDRAQLSSAIINGSSTPPAYRVTITDGGQGAQLGVMATTIQNTVTGKVVELEVHPWMPQGNSLILSDTLPMPDTNVGPTFYMAMVQDYMMVNWPVIQFDYDASTYLFGAMIHAAPAWSGAVCGIAQA